MIGSLTAVLIATSVISHPIAADLKRPALTIPQGQIESRLNPKAVGAAGEKGAWQVLEKDHGKVPSKLKDQAIQHEMIMDELIQENKGDIPRAIMRYNSYKNVKAGKIYLTKVLKRAIEYWFVC